MLQFMQKTTWRMETLLDHFVRAYEPVTFADDNGHEAMDETIAPTASITPTPITPTISPREEEWALNVSNIVQPITPIESDELETNMPTIDKDTIDFEDDRP